MREDRADRWVTPDVLKHRKAITIIQERRDGKQLLVTGNPIRKKVIHIGGTRTNSIDVRIVVAANRDLKEMVIGGTFRRDLYYRFNMVSLTILLLRERADDIPYDESQTGRIDR
jgi:sigma54-dependent transcription regulator